MYGVTLDLYFPKKGSIRLFGHNKSPEVRKSQTTLWIEFSKKTDGPWPNRPHIGPGLSLDFESGGIGWTKLNFLDPTVWYCYIADVRSRRCETARLCYLRFFILGLLTTNACCERSLRCIIWAALTPKKIKPLLLFIEACKLKLVFHASNFYQIDWH